LPAARLREGRWVSAEGAIYDEWRDDTHVVDPFEIPRDWPRFIAVDFGYVNPFVAQWWAVDGDGRMYLYREIYKTQRLVEEHADHMKRLTAGVKADEWARMDDEARWKAVRHGEKIEYVVCDHDAEGRATLEKHTGMRIVAANKAVLDGIQAVQARIKLQRDGKPRIMILRDALAERDADLVEAKLPTCTKEEISGYVWSDKKTKEEPVKEDDHGVDTARYATASRDLGLSKPTVAAVAVRRGGRFERERRR